MSRRSIAFMSAISSSVMLRFRPLDINARLGLRLTSRYYFRLIVTRPGVRNRQGSVTPGSSLQSATIREGEVCFGAEQRESRGRGRPGLNGQKAGLGLHTHATMGISEGVSVFQLAAIRLNASRPVEILSRRRQVRPMPVKPPLAAE